MSKFDDLVKKLREIFQIDKPELDFGIYRILNARAEEINEYLNIRLKEKVKLSLAEASNANSDALRAELEKKEAQYKADGIDPNSVPKILELKEQIALLQTGSSEHESAVYSNLLTFFSRYFDKGDFISQRRYKGDTYAIPYSGEEVVLHWANKDQYYTKSSENFSNYAFKLEDGRTVRFKLISADTAKDNRKDNDKDRNFVLIEAKTISKQDEEGEEYEEELLPIEVINNELIIKFEYAVTASKKQEELVLEACNKILANETVKQSWLELSKLVPTEKNPGRTVLEKCLTSYTGKNNADYFIHKNLKKFLSTELDFYIKNEIMNLDDLQYADKFSAIEKNLRMIQSFRLIGNELIDFLSSLEDFQKKLWLKKKFVVDSHYCLTLDRVPEALYSQIVENNKQWEQWKSLGMLEEKKEALFNQAKIGTLEYLKTNQFLMVDTSLYSLEFKDLLLKNMHDLDESLDGVLLHGDNFQGLGLLQERYREQVKCIYIDPPYNTAASEIIYKNGYKHSSWVTLMYNRLYKSSVFLSTDGIIQVAIDDAEQRFLNMALDLVHGSENFIANISIEHNAKGIPQVHISATHEYLLMYAKDKLCAVTNDFKIEDGDIIKKYPLEDQIGRYRELPLTRTGSEPLREDRPYMFFPFLYDISSAQLSAIPKEEYVLIYNSKTRKFNDLYLQELKSKYEKMGLLFILPKNSKGTYYRWKWGIDSCREGIINNDLLVRNNTIYNKDRINNKIKPKSLWSNSRYDATSKGTRVLKDFFNEKKFDYPKSVYAVLDAITIGANSNSLILDYFAGSGTTAHAVINLNREDQGKRKYILMEQGEYFDTVLKPRIQKVVYSADWKDGKAQAPETGISHAFKVLKIESYEDTLNNLELKRKAEQIKLLDNKPKALKDNYLVHYMLDIESRGSLLSVEDFKKPFDYKLKVSIDSAGAYDLRPVDLIETFNYLIGLRVKEVDVDRKRGFAFVKGNLPSGEKTLIIWRDAEKINYEELERLCEKHNINPIDSEYEFVYINGDHTIPSVFTSLESEGNITKSLKIRQIEPEFLEKMFNVMDI